MLVALGLVYGDFAKIQDYEWAGGRFLVNCSLISLAIGSRSLDLDRAPLITVCIVCTGELVST
jgi:hypothetical protein